MKNFKGYLFIALAALSWGISATVAKHFFNNHYSPLIVVQMRVTISFIILFAYFFFKKKNVLKFEPKHIPLFLFVGICGVAASNYFYYSAIKESNVATSIMLQYTAPILVILYAALVQKEKITRQKYTALFLSLLGIFLVIGGFHTNIFSGSNKGIIYALLAAIAFANFNISGKFLTQKYSSWTSLIYVLASASIFWFVVTLPNTIFSSHYSIEEWGVFLLISILSILIPYSSYFYGLKFIPSSKAIITSTLEPVIAVAAEILFLGGVMTTSQYFGAICVLTAIIFLQMSKK